MPNFAESEIAANYCKMPHYQAFYWLALSTVGKLSVQDAPWWYKWCPSPILSIDVEAVVEQIRGRLGGERSWQTSDLSDFVGRYTLKQDNKVVKFAIDSHDLKDIVSPAALEWCDIYFKANKWCDEHYSEKVVPIVNGNGFLRPRHYQKLRHARHTAKTNDILFISRIWGGVEHNVKLFEELALLPGKKHLVAIFVPGTASIAETEDAKKRLERVGVKCTYDLFSASHLWREMAASKVVVVRAGKHMCIPWRMIDALCMGSCVVSDSDFLPDWPQKLVPGEHYLSAGIKRPADTASASKLEYQKMREAISTVLTDQSEQNRLRANSAYYFDNYASPENVGEYILSSLKSM